MTSSDQGITYILGQTLQLTTSDPGGRVGQVLGRSVMNNTLKARRVIAEARDLLGGNGILLDYHVIRHMADIESIYTYEGTEHIQTLIVGRDITGVGAFS